MKKQLENGGILIMTCKERFLKYIAVSTASDEDSTESPSTTRQLELSRRLAEEMLSLGLKNVHMDSCGNAIGTLPATEGVKAAGTLALVAHVDTSPAASGEGVNAREVLYTGEDIELGHGVILDAKRGDVGGTASAYARAYLTPASAGGVSSAKGLSSTSGRATWKGRRRRSSSSRR